MLRLLCALQLVGSHMQHAGGLTPPRARSAYAYTRVKLNLLTSPLYSY